MGWESGGFIINGKWGEEKYYKVINWVLWNWDYRMIFWVKK